MMGRTAAAGVDVTTELPPPMGAPTLVACPACGAPFPWPPTARCRRCAADLTSASAERIFAVDRRAATLAEERAGALRELVATRPAPAAPAASALATAPPPTGPPSGPPRVGPPTPARRPLGVPTLLGLAGAALLTAAAAVFTAVAWALLPLIAKAAVLVAATAAAAFGALTLHRRDVPIAAASVGLLAMALVIVDVNGAERAGLLVEELVPGLALLGAAGMGAWLSSRTVRWVGAVGAAAMVLGALLLTVGIVDLHDLGPAGATLIGTAAAVGVAASGLVWPERIGTAVLPIAGVVGVTFAGLATVIGIGETSVGIGPGLATLALPLGLLAAGTTRSRLLTGPITFLATLTVPAVCAALAVDDAVLFTATIAAVAAVAWTRTALPTDAGIAGLVGAVPAGLLGAVGLAMHTLAGVERAADHLAGAAAPVVDEWGAIGWVVAAVGALSVRQVRARSLTVLVLTAAMVAPALPFPGPWLLLVAAGLVAAGTGRHPVDGLAGLAGGVLSIGWAAPDALLVAVTAAATAGLSYVVLRRSTEVVAEIAAGVGLLAVGTAAGGAAYATDAGLAIALGAGLVALAAAAAATLASEDALLAPPATLAATTIALAVLAPSSRSAGVLLLLAAVGWLAQALVGWTPARWVAAVVASVGNAALLRSADVDVIEAYTAVPALLLAVVGVAWLRERRDLPSHVALWPALSVGLVPSLLVLADAPTALPRTLALTAAAGALAIVGLQLRWRALVAAGGATAAWVALTQLSIVVEVLPRWITFGIVGVLLVWLAATYEDQQRRVVGVGRRLLELR